MAAYPKPKLPTSGCVDSWLGEQPVLSAPDTASGRVLIKPGNGTAHHLEKPRVAEPADAKAVTMMVQPLPCRAYNSANRVVYTQPRHPRGGMGAQSGTRRGSAVRRLADIPPNPHIICLSYYPEHTMPRRKLVWALLIWPDACSSSDGPIRVCAGFQEAPYGCRKV